MAKGSRLVKMIVCDMFGTVVKDCGAINKALDRTFSSQGIFLGSSMRRHWFDSNMVNVISDTVNEVCNRSPAGLEHIIRQSETIFRNELEKIYAEEKPCVTLIDNNIPNLFDELRKNDIIVALNTNFSELVQKNIMDQLSLNHYVDDCISRDMVKLGRPAPHMIWQLMNNNDIDDPSTVVKIGDSVDDIKEGKNANCGIVAGVLTGSSTRQQLEKYNPNVVFDTVVDLRNYMRRNFIIF